MALDAVAVTLPTAMIMGLAFGAGPCNLTCLPYLGPVFLHGGGVRRSWRTVLPFSAGRMSGYAALGLAAGLAGHGLTQWLHSSNAGWLLGGAAIAVGLSLLRRRGRACPVDSTVVAQTVTRPAPAVQAPRRSAMPGGLFAMGAGLALNPCAPLAAVVAAAAASGSAAAGVSLGLAFGVGAVVVPSLVFGLAVAHFGAELRTQLGRWRNVLELASAAMLILLGTGTATGWVQP